MKQTQTNDSVVAKAATSSTSRHKLLSRAFLGFLTACSPLYAACSPLHTMAQESGAQESGAQESGAQESGSTARFASLTPSVFRSTATDSATGQSRPAFHRLQRVSADQLTQLMVGGLGKWAQGERSGGQVVIELPRADGAFVDGCKMTIDQSNHTVQLTGNHQSVEAWLGVVQTMDSVEAQAGRRGFSYLPVSRQTTALQGLLQSNQIRRTTEREGASIRLASSNGGLPVARRAAWQDQDGPTQVAPPTEQIPTEQLPTEQFGQDDTFYLPGTSLQITVDRNTGALILTGTDEEIEQFKRILQQLGEQAQQTKPQSEVKILEHSNSQALGAVVQNLYNEVYLSRFGVATVTPIAEPNALVLSGSPQAIQELTAIIARLDIESDVRGTFTVFRMKHIAATNAANRLGAFFRVPPSLPGQTQAAPLTQTVLIIPDPRSNVVIMKGGSAELRQAEELLSEIDVVDADHIKTQEMKIIQLRNSVATDMAQVIFAAINGNVAGATPVLGSPAQQGLGGGFGGGQLQQAQPNQDPSVASTALRLKLMSIDQDTGVIGSGILFDVKVVADATSNSLIITGPPESLPLVELLIRQLDRLPDAETQLKVFTILNGDAQQLFDMLNQLFASQQQQGGGFGGLGGQNDGLNRLPLRSGSSDQTLINLRFALELRTNTIIAAGSAGDLQVVEDLLTTLDRSNGDRFIKKIFRLSNAPAEDTANTLTATYAAEQQNLAQDPTTQAPIVSVRRRVVVQADAIQNHLIVIATPETMMEIEGMITALDRRPNTVAIQVMIAEVALNQTEEFGLEFGVQDSIVFDRGLAGANIIGFPFNQAGSGNNLTASGLATRENLAGQGLMNFGLGRTNGGLGYGGLVLSAGNESINILLRALKDQGRLQVLSRPHLMTIDNLNARIQIGQRVAFPIGSTIAGAGVVQNNIEFQDVGIILEVVPRVGPDGLITMLVNVTNSSLGSESEGTVVSTDAQGNAVRLPPINITESITTAIARSDQTVILSGLLRTQKQYFKRGIPFFSDLPRLGPLFSYQNERQVRTELLIFLTPTIISSHEDMAMHNQMEMDRLNWCFQDVLDLHGPIGNIYEGNFADGSGPEEVYPELRTPGVPQYRHGRGYPDHFDPQEFDPEGHYHEIPPQSVPSVPLPLGKTSQPQNSDVKTANGLTPVWRKNQ